jgi:hypothetical protein
MNSFYHSQLIVCFSSMPNKIGGGYRLNKSIEFDSVVGSVIEFNKVINYDSVIKLINNLNNVSSFCHNKKFIVIDVSMYGNMEPTVLINKENFYVIDINFKYFLIYTNKNDYEFWNNSKIKNFTVLNGDQKVNGLKRELLSNIGYLFKLNLAHLFQNENLNSLVVNYDIIFVFKDITWENIVSMLRMNRIKLYGGSNTRKHILSTVQAKLSMFFLLLNDLRIDYNILYNSFNSPNTSKGKYNECFEDYIHFDDFLKTNITEYFSVGRPGHSLPKGLQQFIHHNLIIKCYDYIIEHLDQITKLEQDKIILENNIKDADLRIVKYSHDDNIDFSNHFRMKKISNANKCIQKCSEAIININNKVQSLNDEIQIIILKLYKLDNKLFYEDGHCILNNMLRVDFDLYEKYFNKDKNNDIHSVDKINSENHYNNKPNG